MGRRVIAIKRIKILKVWFRQSSRPWELPPQALTEPCLALIIRMDDFGYKLIALDDGKNGTSTTIGKFLIAALPKVIKSLTVIGTLAMLLVAGGIYMHNISALHGMLHGIPSILGEMGVGLLVGIVALTGEKQFNNAREYFRA